MPEDQRRLKATIAAIRPGLLLLDPLVRLHRLDENSSREISGFLGYIRELQREFDVAVVLTHHSSKREHTRPGQGLRGSGDLHSFGDSNLYLTRKRDGMIMVTTEHRGAAPIEPFAIELKPQNDSASLFVAEGAISAEDNDESKGSLAERVTDHLSSCSAPIPKAQLRAALRVNNQRLGEVLHGLKEQGNLVQHPNGWALASSNV